MYTAIDLFSGAGGLSLGLGQAGFEPILAVEIDSDSCVTYNGIFPSAHLIEGPIQELDFRQWFGDVDLVAGGPPCQPFSSGGKRLGKDDERDMLPHFFRAVREIQPPLFLMENVPGLVQPSRKAYLKGFLDDMGNLGYEITWQVLHAADYGVPQKRRRLFVIGSRLGTFSFPEPTHGPAVGKAYVPAGNFVRRDEVVGEPNPSKVTYAKNPDLRPSPYDGHLFNGGGRPINLNDASPTILASAGGNKTHFIDTLDEVPVYHAELLAGKSPRRGILEGGRRLTVLESAALQTFPAEIRFHGSRSSQYRQVGNAVPPLLARKIGEMLRGLMFGNNRKVSGF